MDKLLLGLVVIILLIFFMNKGDYEPSQKDIQSLEYVDKTKAIKDFPYPQISYGVQKLSKGELPKPLNNLDEILPNGDDIINIIRNKDTPDNMTKKRVYLPDYYRKDRLSSNDIGSEELRSFNMNNDESESSWSDDNVSEHPKFYTSDVKDELTNIGAFFDKNNQYHDKTSSNTNVLTSDKCYTDKNGERFCMDNTRLQLIPPQLITDPQNCYALNDVGLYKERNDTVFNDKKVINGGRFFNSIVASEVNNETFDKPIDIQSGSCQI